MNAALRFAGVTKRYGAQQALAGASFEVPTGSVCGLVGPNGAGKTTAFAIAAGLIRADGGTVDVLGNGAFDPGTMGGALGLLPQDAALPPHLKVDQVLTQYARLQGLTPDRARFEVDKRLDEVDLTDRRGAQIRTLSHGMRRRVQVAQALLGDPALVLLDEPMGGLDPHLVVRIRGLLKAQRNHRTLVISSHVLGELEAMCDHVIIMEAGTVVRSGSMEGFVRGQTLVRILTEHPMVTLPSVPDVALEQVGNTIEARGPDGWTVAKLNAVVLPALMQADVPIIEVNAGASLESAYLSERLQD